MDDRVLTIGDVSVVAPGVALDNISGATSAVDPSIPVGTSLSSLSAAPSSSTSGGGVSDQVTAGLFNLGTALLGAGAQVGVAAANNALAPRPRATGLQFTAPAAPSSSMTPLLILGGLGLLGFLLLRRKG